jgi:hypothetical protein
VDVTDKDIAIMKLFQSDEKARISQEELAKLTRGRYQRVTNNYNALYEAARQTKITSQSGDVDIVGAQE